MRLLATAVFIRFPLNHHLIAAMVAAMGKKWNLFSFYYYG
ncbi:protein of unknown function [Xenorhabdus poinarii G6]|uniref:Uncharacterized protein n=1 Tax=Xenorhabdus poinarii G6 TaxID=1354304 RepID=A0A068R6A0_9GAMM|nr:protein of unknown function [Xenorhabdus poinarii G6]